MSHNPINILILAAGTPAFEVDAANGYPLCLTEKEGVTILERIVENSRDIAGAKFTFAMLDDDIRKFHLDNVVKRLVPDARLVRVAKGTRGSACTALLAASTMDPDSDLLVISANELVDVDLAMVVARFRERDLDGGALAFRSIHPRYSYVQLGEEGHVVQAAQQNPISEHATTGVFWYRNTGSFVEAAKSMIRKDANVGGSFFVCPVFNEMLLAQCRIGVQPIAAGHYHPVKSERQLHTFENAAALGAHA